MNEITIIFDYKASGGQIKGLDEFKKELQKNYLRSVRPNRKPQAGGLWDVFVEFYVNISLKEFILSAIAGGLLWDLVKIGTRKFVFRPLVQAFEKLENENQNLDYIPVIRMTFDDVQLCFYGVNKNFFVGVSEVFKILFKDYNKIINLTDQDLYTIHIPAYLDTEITDREIYKIDPDREPSRQDFTKYWALSYTIDHERDVLDVENLRLLDKDWAREGQTFKSR